MKRAIQRTGRRAMTATYVVGLVGAGLLGAAPGESIGDATIRSGRPIALAGTGCPLPPCIIDFEPPACPDEGEICGAMFDGGAGCVIDGLPFCYSSGLFSYRIDPGSPLTISLSGDLMNLDVFFANITDTSGEMHFFDADSVEIGTPLETNGECELFMPDMQLVVFDVPVRFIEVTATGGQVYIDDFSINPGFEPPLGDLNGDCVVGIPDLLALLAAWGPCEDPCPPSCPADLNKDCNVGIPDLLLLLANWG